MHSGGALRSEFRLDVHLADSWDDPTFLLFVAIPRSRADRSCAAARMPCRLMLPEPSPLVVVVLARLSQAMVCPAMHTPLTDW